MRTMCMCMHFSHINGMKICIKMGKVIEISLGVCTVMKLQIFTPKKIRKKNWWIYEDSTLNKKVSPLELCSTNEFPRMVADGPQYSIITETSNISHLQIALASTTT